MMMMNGKRGGWKGGGGSPVQGWNSYTDIRILHSAFRIPHSAFQISAPASLGLLAPASWRRSSETPVSAPGSDTIHGRMTVNTAATQFALERHVAAK